MIKEIAWNTFKNTGNVDTYLEMKQLENSMISVQKVEVNEYSKNEGDNNFGK